MECIYVGAFIGGLIVGFAITFTAIQLIKEWRERDEQER